MLFAGVRADHRAGIELPPIDAHRAAEAATNLQSGFDYGVTRQASPATSFGDDNRDRLADMADCAKRRNRVRCQDEGRAAAALERHLMRVRRRRTVRDRPQAIPFSIAAGQHREDARHPLGRSGIYPRDQRMRGSVRRRQRRRRSVDHLHGATPLGHPLAPILANWLDNHMFVASTLIGFTVMERYPAMKVVVAHGKASWMQEVLEKMEASTRVIPLLHHYPVSTEPEEMWEH